MNAAMQNDWIDEYRKGKEEKYNKQNGLYVVMRLWMCLFSIDRLNAESFICSVCFLNSTFNQPPLPLIFS